jgi:uracil-DNA glycosylase
VDRPYHPLDGLRRKGHAMWDRYWTDRGAPWEHDPGPPSNRNWARLFAETPNYRGLGKAVVGREAFRWHFGPMFYRGRLGDGQVKVLIVGQEGAQDESLAHRAFAGGTGARMQHLLMHLGITRSYLFLNTFVYPIFGQYGAELRVLAQDPASPIRRHRNRIFDYLVARNDLQLAIAVGTAAKESLANWIASHGGNAQPGRLHEADASVISPQLRVLGVLHPGGATGGAGAAIVADFKAAIARIEHWRSEDPGWLGADPDGQPLPAADYRYRSAPIPFRDLPYGVAWRVGRGGTSSNRRDGQTAIQLFSADGAYNNAGHVLTYSASTAGSAAGYAQEAGDLPYEPPRARYRDFDRGPGVRFARLMQGGEPGLAWPDFDAFGLPSHPSMGHGPIYRGRLERPGILVLADAGCHDDLFTGRALTGDDGQHTQAFLRAAGLTHAYAIVRVLPVDVLDAMPAHVRAAIDAPATQALYGELIRRANPDVVIAAGPLAGRLLTRLNLDGLPALSMRAYGQAGWKPSWGQALGTLAGLAYRRDLPHPTFTYGGEREQIPRNDLPYGTLRWQGSSGDRAQRARRGGAPSFDYYKIVMPAWAAALPAEPLSAAELQAVVGLT